MQGQIIPQEFYQRDAVVELSIALLGKYLCTFIDGQFTAGMVVETEAYRAPEDKASHAYGNRRTKRTETMFGPGGHAYIYLCYGIHHLFNVVTGDVNEPHAILIRAVEPKEGLDCMVKRREMGSVSKRLTSGPGKLSAALGITTVHNGVNLATGKEIWIEDREVNFAKDQIIASPRVGVDYAGECALWNWRFRVIDNEWCSPAK